MLAYFWAFLQPADGGNLRRQPPPLLKREPRCAMQMPTQGPVWRAVRWVLVPLVYPEYRRLVIRTYVLSIRLELLCTLFAVVSPFATPGLLLLLRRWFDNLRVDVAEFGRAVRARKAGAVASIGATAPPAPVAARSLSGEFQNPWL
jgi:hypothetical protein